jgi:hypothetical protein
MEIALLVVAVIIVAAAILAVAGGPLFRRQGDAAETQMRTVAGGANVDKQFKRPPDEGGLL